MCVEEEQIKLKRGASAIKETLNQCDSPSKNGICHTKNTRNEQGATEINDSSNE